MSMEQRSLTDVTRITGILYFFFIEFNNLQMITF